MVLSNKNILDQAIERGKRPDIGTTGPFAPAFRDPLSIKDPWVSKLNEQPGAKDLFTSSSWPSKDAAQAQMLYDSSDLNPRFTTKEDDILGKDFLAKYIQGVQKGIVNDPVRGDLYTEAPGQGLRSDLNIAGRIEPPGAKGTSTT